MTADELRRLCAEHGITVSLGGLLREADVARVLGVAPRTLRQWRQDGEGPAVVRVGGAYRYPIEGVAAALTPLAESGEIRQKPAERDIDRAEATAEDAAHVLQQARK